MSIINNKIFTYTKKKKNYKKQKNKKWTKIEF